MTGRVVEGAPTGAPPVLPAAVSLALAALVEGPLRHACVLGVADPAVWIGEADDVVVLSSGDAVRLPNSIVVAAPSARRPFAGFGVGDRVLIGRGALHAGRLQVTATRWFDPVPALPASTPATVEAALEALEGAILPMEDHGLAAALAADDDRAARRAARLLIGRGDGLTPRGDDQVAGTVAGMLLIGRSLGADLRILGRLGGPILTHASSATTSLSAALLRHAFRGEVAEPAGRLLMALAGRGEPVAAARELAAVGHSSGPALAAGVAAGARAAIERSR